LALAAQRFNVPPERLSVTDGVIRSDDSRTVAYGELVSDQMLHVNATGATRLRDASTHKIVGKSWQRLDIPPKVTGGVAYVQDLRLDGMVHGRIVRPPGPAARLREVATGSVEKSPGVLKVVRDGSFLAVIAEREYQAIVAMRNLAKAAQWDDKATLPD